MTEQTPQPTAPAGNGQADPNAPQFAPQAVYIKDVSFEAPNGPRVQPNTTTAPSINLNMNTTVNDLGPELREVVLTVHLQALVGDKSLWLVELQQAGAFAMRNFPQDQLPRLLGIFCPDYLLPYARQTISDLLLKGGFPPFLLPPVNFEALYNQAVQQQMQQQQMTPTQPN
ncbi:MAG TPA: protein-export chaperone SecB [Steroidobacteraceae bacterium]|nr:protein-export chaperone SecB [Steroidobacteraceae bacterium]